MLYVTYFASILLLAYGILSLRKEKKQKVNSRISYVFQLEDKTSTINSQKEIKRLTFSQRVIEPLWTQLRRTFQKNINSEKKGKIEDKLLQAGNPLGMTSVEYRMIQLALRIILPLLFGIYSFILQLGSGITLLFVVAGIIIASYLPNLYLQSKTKARNKAAQKDLPDFLDLLTVSMEAGLGFDSALSKVVAKKNGVLSNEFQRCLEEMRLGKTRKQALSGVRNRLTVDDIKSLIGSIIQAEQLGIGMVQILSVQAEEIRQKRKQRAEEQAMKAPIKMLFPLVMFIFPCIFIVLLGPAVISIIETL